MHISDIIAAVDSQAGENIIKAPLTVTRIHRDPVGAPILFRWNGSWGRATQRIEVKAGSKFFRYAIRLVDDTIQRKIQAGQFKNDPNWKVLQVKEGANGAEETVLVSVISLSKRLQISKEEIYYAIDGVGLERLIAYQSRLV